MTGRLQGKTALITGAASGLGAAIAKAYAREGANVCCVDLYPHGRAEAMNTIHQRSEKEQPIDDVLRQALGAQAEFVRADVSQETEVTAAVQRCVDRFGRLDIMVNNAGISCESAETRLVRLHETAEASFDQTMAVNAKGIFLGCKHAISQMLRQAPLSGSPDGVANDAGSRPCRGWIINTASVLGLSVLPGVPSYCASKGAAVMLTKQIALDYAQDGIYCNALCPGAVDTPMSRHFLRQPHLFNDLSQKHPLGIGQPEDIANMAVVLASDDVQWMTGVALPVDGGFLLH